MDQEIALTYVRKRKRRKRAAIISGISSIGIAIFLIIAFCMIQIDRFTITIDKSPGICLSIDNRLEQDERPTYSEVQKTTQLAALPLLRATDTQYKSEYGNGIPEDIENGVGDKNTYHYFAYSFYLGGEPSATTSLINYEMDMYIKGLDDISQGIGKAIKIMIVRNGIKDVYAARYEDGSAKPIYYSENTGIPKEQAEKIGYAIPFHDNKHIILQPYAVVPGEFDKFTVVIWIDGWESDDSMKGENFSAELKFSTKI